MILIKQAKCMINNQEVIRDIRFDEHKIHEISEHLEAAGDEIIHAHKKVYAMPGLIDVHVHLRDYQESYKETIASGTKAAAHGGFTSIFAMPNFTPAPDQPTTMQQFMQKIKNDSCVHVYPYACISKQRLGKELSDMKGLSAMGIHCFSDDGSGIANDECMLKAMQRARELGLMIVAHTEDLKYRLPQASMHEGACNQALQQIGIPSICEYAQLERDLKLAKVSGARYHVCHLSAKESVQYLRAYKKQNVDCSGEVSAHHLILSENDVKDAMQKMNPPLRSPQDREALIQGLLDGSIDLIASDHAPHSDKEKAQSLKEAPFGIVSLETSFALLYTKLVKTEKRFNLAQLIYWMSEAPAKRFNLKNKGQLKAGFDADIVLVDVDTPFQIDSQNFYSLSKNTPFQGWECYGEILKTFVDGKVVYEKERTK